ncbi:MAG: NTP transferase domain-containing protein [Chloroflexi bacterium]|nr:NTP transferase domain-containing protein [Chloroflexota bacterium]
MTDPARTTAVVLAAGAGTRFGGGKLSAPLGDRRVIDHVLDALAQVGFAETIVVVGPGPDAPSLPPGGVRVVVNPRPQNGLSSSLRIGLSAVDSSSDAALVVLGDQPFIRATTVRALLAVEVPVGRSLVVPRYAADGGSNPVLVLRSGWGIAAAIDGDRGLGPTIAANPDLVVEVTVIGSNPDVDTRGDLAAAAWAAQVRANREQVDRVREVGDGDFYATTSGLFVADPRRSDADDPTLAALRSLAGPGERWLDIGAGAGRYALPIALAVGPAGEVVAVEASASMLAGLRAGMSDHRIANVRIVEGRWPAVAPEIAAPLMDGAGPPAQVALIAHVGYDIEEIGPFLDAMEVVADRLCVAILMERTPAAAAEAFWPIVHGEDRIPLPALDPFVALLQARGGDPEFRIVERSVRGYADRAAALALLRRQTWVEPGGTRDLRLQAALDERLSALPDGTVAIDGAPTLSIGLVTWRPR